MGYLGIDSLDTMGEGDSDNGMDDDDILGESSLLYDPFDEYSTLELPVSPDRAPLVPQSPTPQECEVLESPEVAARSPTG